MSMACVVAAAADCSGNGDEEKLCLRKGMKGMREWALRAESRYLRRPRAAAHSRAPAGGACDEAWEMARKRTRERTRMRGRAKAKAKKRKERGRN